LRVQTSHASNTKFSGKKIEDQIARVIFIIKLERRAQFTMIYFDNLDNESLNKYKKNLKNIKKIIYVFFYF
jgi:hypothetical protein